MINWLPDARSVMYARGISSQLSAIIIEGELFGTGHAHTIDTQTQKVSRSRVNGKNWIVFKIDHIRYEGISYKCVVYSNSEIRKFDAHDFGGLMP